MTDERTVAEDVLPRGSGREQPLLADCLLRAPVGSGTDWQPWATTAAFQQGEPLSIWPERMIRSAFATGWASTSPRS